MNKINYQRLLDKKIEQFQKENITPHILIHSCCAPCSSYVLSYMTNYFKITDFYYNPNIEPAAEYDKRVIELKRLISEMELKNPVEFVVGEYDNSAYREAVKFFEGEKEGGKRCSLCFHMRLSEAAKKAKELGIKYCTTTLTISPMKNVELINRIGESVSKKYNVTWIPSEFRKKGGFQRSIELSRKYDLYRQNYCGCIFSKFEIDEKHRLKLLEENDINNRDRFKTIGN